MHMILEAFNESHQLPLVIVGNWDNSDYGRGLKKRYEESSNILLFDPIYDHDTLNVLRSNAELYVHGHSAGGTNPSLVEAMGLNLPILAYDVVYNKITTEYEAFYFGSVKKLKNTLKFKDYLPLKVVGDRMKEIADRRYTWNVIARKYATIVTEPKSIKAPTPVFNFELPVSLRFN